MPTEWDEADLAFRVRAAGWKVAACGYERLGAYHHVGSSTLGTLSDAYKARVLRNGRLFLDHVLQAAGVTSGAGGSAVTACRPSVVGLRT